MKKDIKQPHINDVLARIGDFSQKAGLLKSGSDASLAEVLGVSRQVFAGWKKRGTLPWEKIWEFSVRYELSMTYLLAGEWEMEHYVHLGEGQVNPVALEFIGAELLEAAEDTRQLEGESFDRFLTGPSMFHIAALINNKTIHLVDDSDAWSEAISAEAKYAVALECRSYREHLVEMAGHAKSKVIAEEDLESG